MRKKQLVNKSSEARQAIATAQAGGSDSYERVLTSLMPELADFLRARLRDHPVADDIVQKVLLAIHHSRQTYIPREKCLSPLLRAILNGGRSAD